jgi:hypothetical protein
MATASESLITKKRRQQGKAEHAVPKIDGEVFRGRRDEILRYLRLFGYKQERTILQVHIAGYFKRGRKNMPGSKKSQASSRYGGTTFVIVGRSHDPRIMDLLIKPKKKADQSSPGYVGYLWKGKNKDSMPPHELLPLDFTPTQVPYPQDWKDIFATRGFMIAMHVPSGFAPRKNRLNRALYRVGKNVDVKARWDFLDEVEQYGYEQSMAAQNREQERQTAAERSRTAIA